MNTTTTHWLLAAAFAITSVTGCQDQAGTPTTGDPVSELPPDTLGDHHDHDHGHPSEGPHHGELIELGAEEYHAELLHDHDAGSLTIYILDSSATKQVAIEATEVTINVTHDGMPEQFTLTAQPDEGDDEGKSSRFVSTDKELAAHIDDHDASPKLVVSINGKSYRGDIHHDHEGHDHDHAHDHGE